MTAIDDPRAALSESVDSLRRLANYQLPERLNRRVLDLSERKESLTPDEHAELLDWVQFTQERSIEKFSAIAALRRLRSAFSEVTETP